MTYPTPFQDRNATGAAWTSLAEQQTWLEGIAANESRVEFDQVGTSTGARRIDLVRVGAPTPKPYADLDRVLLIVNTQHGNEPAGREASFQLIAELATSTDPDVVAYLESNTVCVVPVANPDGFNSGARTVPGTSNTDMNREHLNLSIVETATIQELVRDLRPSIVVDTHETGQVDAGNVEVRWGENVQIDQAVRVLGESLTQDFVRPALTAQGITNGLWASSTLETVLRNFAGLRHSLALLTETSRDTPDRVNRTFIQKVCLDAALHFHRTENAAVLEAVNGAVTRKIQEGEAHEASFNVRAATINPQPAGYVLTPSQYESVELHREVFAIADRETTDGNYFLSMGQEAQPILPFLLDARANNNQIAALAVDEPPALMAAVGRFVRRGGELVDAQNGVIRGGQFAPI